jgi:hypothetical protein
MDKICPNHLKDEFCRAKHTFCFFTNYSFTVTLIKLITNWYVYFSQISISVFIAVKVARGSSLRSFDYIFCVIDNSILLSTSAIN